jgi:hypothetical protein
LRIISSCPQRSLLATVVAPESKRPLLFAVISRDEECRLAELLRPIQTINDAIEKLGTPDF